MLEAGIELHELRPDAAACQRLIRVSLACAKRPAFAPHSKSLVLDRRVVYVGSFNLNLRPDSSWQVLQRQSGGLEWVTEVDGREVRDTHEPMTGFWKRFSSRLYRLFPLEKYL
ncbi:MAG: hypothetical protein EXR82_01570 [Gammaproteobacteria bacterium]|nr:hypothetical protein [Gammaproteobacteria bacterium]